MRAHRSDSGEGYDPELPVLERAHLDVFVELLLHVVVAVTRDWDPRGRELLLTQTEETNTGK